MKKKEALLSKEKNEICVVPLGWLVRRNDCSGLERALIIERANPDVVDGKGYSALMWAAKLEYLNCIKILAKNGAMVGHKNVEGLSALSIAIFEGKQEACAMLLDLGAQAGRMEKNILLSMDSINPGSGSRKSCFKIIDECAIREVFEDDERAYLIKKHGQERLPKLWSRMEREELIKVT